MKNEEKGVSLSFQVWNFNGHDKHPSKTNVKGNPRMYKSQKSRTIN
jgi:hypothetical protein